MQILPNGVRRSQFLWISDFLPDEAAPMVSGLVDQGVAALKQRVEAGG